MVKAARAAKMQIMVGCMVAGSLSMAPAVLLAQLADIVDLDGPLWLAEDAPYGLAYDDGQVSPANTGALGLTRLMSGNTHKHPAKAMIAMNQ